MTMHLWRYEAIDPRQPRSARRTGELSGDSAAAVRWSLRRIGLQALHVRPVRACSLVNLPSFLTPLRLRIRAHLRARRRLQRAELYDSLATMLEAGEPLLQAIETLLNSCGTAESWRRSMLQHLRESLRSGQSLGQALAQHPAWFDVTEIAIVEAGQMSGDLSPVLKSLAEHQERSGQLSQRLAAALAYPLLVMLVGVGVTLFLSLKTLPQLTSILVDSNIPVPRLTTIVMSLGQTLVRDWQLLLVAMVVTSIAFTLRSALANRMSVPPLLRRVMESLPGAETFRALALSGVCVQLAQMAGSGIPIVDALRVLAPTTSNRHLRKPLLAAADAVERGDDLASAFHDARWFNPEFRRLLEIGQASGELDVMLRRLGERYERQARRLIDRLAGLLEPAALLTLAFLVGTVVMSAVLPLLRLQEILR